MQFTSVVLYGGGLAHYHVTTLDGKSFYANLLLFTGKEGVYPPERMQGTKMGRHWEGTAGRQDLIDDIGYDVGLHF